VRTIREIEASEVATVTDLYPSRSWRSLGFENDTTELKH
jgi:hypothetical protein